MISWLAPRHRLLHTSTFVYRLFGCVSILRLSNFVFIPGLFTLVLELLAFAFASFFGSFSPPFFIWFLPKISMPGLEKLNSIIYIIKQVFLKKAPSTSFACPPSLFFSFFLLPTSIFSKKRLFNKAIINLCLLADSHI